MTRTNWLIVICIISVLAALIFSHSSWFQQNEHVAVWLEGVALIVIFALDYINRLDDSEEHERQHQEMLEQLQAAKKQADASSDSVQLLKTQAQEHQLRELWRTLPILDDIQNQMRYWLGLLGENRWNAVNSATAIMPVDSSTVLVQAARHSNELWINVRETFRMLTNADFALSRARSLVIIGSPVSLGESRAACDSSGAWRSAGSVSGRVGGVGAGVVSGPGRSIAADDAGAIAASVEPIVICRTPAAGRRQRL